MMLLPRAAAGVRGAEASLAADASHGGLRESHGGAMVMDTGLVPAGAMFSALVTAGVSGAAASTEAGAGLGRLGGSAMRSWMWATVQPGRRLVPPSRPAAGFRGAASSPGAHAGLGRLGGSNLGDAVVDVCHRAISGAPVTGGVRGAAAAAGAGHDGLSRSRGSATFMEAGQGTSRAIQG